MVLEFYKIEQVCRIWEIVDDLFYESLKIDIDSPF